MSVVHGSSTEACHIHCITICTDLKSRSESSTNSNWQCTGVCNTRVSSSWWTDAYWSLVSPVDDTCVLLVVSSCSCRVTVSAHLVVGPSLLPLWCPGTHFLTTSGIRHEAPPVSVLRWKLHYLRVYLSLRIKCSVLYMRCTNWNLALAFILSKFATSFSNTKLSQKTSHLSSVVALSNTVWF